MPLNSNCAGCLSTIESRQYLRCCVCSDTYDLQCANVPEKRFYNTMTADHKNAWKCPRCICRQPKGDNTNTPVRGTGTDSNTKSPHNDSVNNGGTAVCLSQSEVFDFENITVRRHQAGRTVSNSNSNFNSESILCDIENDTICMTSIRKIIREELQHALSERLTNVISKTVENLFVPILDRVAQLNSRMTALEAKLEMMASDAAVGVPANSTGAIPSPSQMKKSKAGPSKPGPSKSVPSKKTPSEPISSKGESSKMIISSVCEPDSPRQDFRANDEIASLEFDIEGWTEVKRPRRSLGVKRGTAMPGATQLEASERLRYIHVYYLKIGTTDERVRAHLEVVCGEDVCTVETLKAKGNYASFKLTVPSRYAERVMDPSNWAKDIAVKPWRQLFRAQNAKRSIQNSQPPK